MLLEAVQINANIVDVMQRVHRHGFAMVLDDTKLVGVISPGDLDKFLQAQPEGGRAGEICNRTFTYQTIDEFDTWGAQKISQLKATYWPLVDRDGNLLHVYRKSSIRSQTIWRDAQEVEGEFWDDRIAGYDDKDIFTNIINKQNADLNELWTRCRIEDLEIIK